MACLSDPLHLYQLLLLYDLLVYLLFQLDDARWWGRLFVLLNMAFAGLAMLQLAFPDTSFLRDTYMAGILGTFLVFLLVFAYLSSV